MTPSRLTIVGRVLRHAMGVLLLCWLRALKWGGLAGLAGVLAAEIAAVVLTRSFPPDGLAQVVAFALGAALAFGVAATVIADELVVGIIDSIRVLIGEAEAGARAARMAGRREVGQSSGRVLALFGLGGLAAAGAAHRPKTADMLRAPVRAPVGPRDEVGPRLEAMRARVPSTSVARPTPTPTQPLPLENPWAATLTPVSEWPAPHDDTPTLPPPGAPPQHEGLPAAETLLDVAGLASIAGVASTLGEANPVTQPLAQPVHATNLPRIGWATEDVPTLPPETATDERPERFDAFGAPSPITQPMSDAPPAAAEAAPPLAEPSVWHIHETMAAMPERWHNPAAAAEPEPEEPGITPVDLFGAPPPSAPSAPPIDAIARAPDGGTRPLPEKTQPFGAADPAARPRGSVWDHISQVLAGRPVPPIPSDDEPLLGEAAERDSPAPDAGT